MSQFDKVRKGLQEKNPLIQLSDNPVIPAAGDKNAVVEPTENAPGFVIPSSPIKATVSRKSYAMKKNGGRPSKMTDASAAVQEKRLAESLKADATKGVSQRKAQAQVDARDRSRPFTLNGTQVVRLADGSVHTLEDIQTTTMRPTKRGKVYDTEDIKSSKLKKARSARKAQPITLLNSKNSDKAAVITNDTQGGKLAPVTPITANENLAEFPEKVTEQAAVAARTVTNAGETPDDRTSRIKKNALKRQAIKTAQGWMPKDGQTGIYTEGEKRGELLPGYDDYENNPQATTTMRWDPNVETTTTDPVTGKKKTTKGKAFDSGEVPVLPSEEAKRSAVRKKMIDKINNDSNFGEFTVEGAGKQERINLDTAKGEVDSGDAPEGTTSVGGDDEGYEPFKQRPTLPAEEAAMAGEEKTEETAEEKADRESREELSDIEERQRRKENPRDKAAREKDEQLVQTGLAADRQARADKGKRNKADKPAVSRQISPYLPDGSLKPEYDDPNSPLSTTIKEIPGRNAEYESKIRGMGVTQTDPESYRRTGIGTSILKEGEPVKPGKTGKTRYVDPGFGKNGEPRGVRAVPPTKPEVSVSGTSIPLRELFTDDEAGDEARSYAEAMESASGNQITEESRDVATVARRAEKTGTHEVNQNETPAAAQRGTTPEHGAALDARREARMAELEADGKSLTTHTPEVIDTAKQLTIRDASANGERMPTLDDFNTATWQGGQHVRKAYVLHQTGTVNNEDNLDKAAGVSKNENGVRRYTPKAREAISAMYTSLKKHDIFKKTSQPGKGIAYTIDPNGPKEHQYVNPETTHFQTRDGKLMPLAYVDHPDHPLKKPGSTVEGSATWFEGYAPTGRLVDTPTGKRPTYNPIRTKQGHYIDEMTHPETKRKVKVLKFGSVPSGAIADADVLKAAIKKGINIDTARKKIMNGEEDILTLGAHDATNIPQPTGGTRASHAAKTDGIIQAQGSNRTRLTATPTADTVNALGALSVGSGSITVGTDEKGEPLSRKKTEAEQSLITKTRKSGKRGERETRAKANSIAESLKKNTTFAPGTTVFHPTHGIGTVVSHNDDIVSGIKGQTTARVKFTNGEQTLSGTDVMGGDESKGQIHEYVPHTGGTRVVHPKHGVGTLIGSTSHGRGKAHIKFDKGGTKFVEYGTVKPHNPAEQQVEEGE